MHIADMLNEFHEWLGQPFGHPGNRALRRSLHEEEGQELLDALDADDEVQIAQELADVVYVAYGTAHSLGIPLDAVIGEVHRSNMTKFRPDGFTLRGDGKLLKGPDYVPPDIVGILNDARRREEARRP